MNAFQELYLLYPVVVIRDFRLSLYMISMQNSTLRTLSRAIIASSLNTAFMDLLLSGYM